LTDWKARGDMISAMMYTVWMIQFEKGRPSHVYALTEAFSTAEEATAAGYREAVAVQSGTLQLGFQIQDSAGNLVREVRVGRKDA
jgi:hypothetical protein